MFRKLHTKEFNGGPDLRRADYKARNFLAISFGLDPISSDLLSLSHHELELELVSSKKGIKGFPPYEEDPFFDGFGFADLDFALDEVHLIDLDDS